MQFSLSFFYMMAIISNFVIKSRKYMQKKKNAAKYIVE